MQRIRLEATHGLRPFLYLSHDPARSLETQRRIVARIEALMAEVKRARTLLEQIRRDADHSVGRCFSGGHTEDSTDVLQNLRLYIHLSLMGASL